MDTSEYQPEEPTVGRERWSNRSICLLSVLYLLLGLAVFSWLARIENEEIPTGSSCQSNLRQLGLVILMYAENHGGVFPELSPRPGGLASRQDQDYPGVYPEYLDDLTILRCPGTLMGRPRDRWFWEAPPPSPPPLDTASNDESYLYLGYVIPDQAASEQFAEAYRAGVANGRHFDEDLVVTSDNSASSAIPRLRDGAPGITDTDEGLSRIPLIVERYPNGHIPDGGNVLYADGHMEWIKWGAKWPMTPEAMEMLLALDGLGKD